jgi:CheY-like chemotaxis protein
MKQASFEDFEFEVRDALVHLYDPIYQPPLLLMRVLGVAEDGEHVQSTLRKAILRLAPAPDAPPTSRSRRRYELLHCRYVQELTQEETAQRLGITARHLRREQQQAVNALAQRLWNEGRVAVGAENGDARDKKPLPAAGGTPAVQSKQSGQGVQPQDNSQVHVTADAWRMQVREEVALLQQQDPDAIANVVEIAQDVVQLEQKLAQTGRIALELAPVVGAYYAAIHPSLLRQMLIIAVQKLADLLSRQAAGAGSLLIQVERVNKQIRMLISSRPVSEGPLPDSEFIRESIGALGGSMRVAQQGDGVEFDIRVPQAEPIDVLVVDDNHDLVHFYRRYTERTRFRITHVDQGGSAMEAIRQQAPAIIVLDVMLPDMDGWELLAHLHENPATRAIPVVICSVIRQEELALALGAARYMPKPVRRQEFIQALEQVLSQDLAADQRG